MPLGENASLSTEDDAPSPCGVKGTLGGVIGGAYVFTAEKLRDRLVWRVDRRLGSDSLLTWLGPSRSRSVRFSDRDLCRMCGWGPKGVRHGK